MKAVTGKINSQQVKEIAKKVVLKFN